MILKNRFDMFLMGRKCIFCNKYGLYKLKNNRVKCKHCRVYYNLNKLRNDNKVLYFFYLELSARKTAKELNISYNSVSRRYMQFRQKIADYLDEQFINMKGHIEMMKHALEANAKEREAEEHLTKSLYSAYWNETVKCIQGLCPMYQQIY